MTTPILQIPEASTSILSFSLLNIILRHYEQSSLKSVLGLEATPPVSPNDGDAYIVADSGTTGVFAGQENNIAFSIQGAWYFLKMDSTLAGAVIRDVVNLVDYYWDGAAYTRKIREVSSSVTSGANTNFTVSQMVLMDATASSLTFTANLPLPYGKFHVLNVGANSVDVDLDGDVFTVPSGESRQFYIIENGTPYLLP